MARTMTPAERFFWKHAGYSYGPTQTRAEGRRECARELAGAEAWAERMGITFEWIPDNQEWDLDAEEQPREVLGCVVRYSTGTIGPSLWGIGDPSRNYGRVIEAELALEALEEIRNAVGG